MADESPSDFALLELLDRDLAREGAIGLVKYILRRDLEALS